ncbi:FIG00939636: hypothetical protein [hydrothermal vent metagenome]|uniref:Iron-regulated membrane protein n=1 Tax=hydrothermal vent metagenome TaxID=652676 RepID=A0A3B0TPX2_9ZZZZ
MKKNRLIRILRKFHKWPGIIIAFLVILFASSGIIMNHRSILSSVDIPRSLLPSDYHYKNWNLAAVRGSASLGNGTSLMYGNIGVWETTDDFHTFRDFNHGFPSGIDNRKIYSIVNFKDGDLVAGTHFGLYKRVRQNALWEKVKLPVGEERIADLTLKGDTLIVLTRHYLLKSTNLEHFEKTQLPPPVNYKRETGLFNTLWELHSGELFGLAGKLFIDALGLVAILLSVTGLIHFFFPKIIRRKKKRGKAVAALHSTKRKNLKWHNVVGYIFIFFLVIDILAGMFLRPPLLIAIANSKVGILPYTHLDSPNPWFDKLRRVAWDKYNKQYIFSTSEGFYFTDESLTNPLQPFKVQPPVSVMGCNVFKQVGDNVFLVGSFSGMFLWNTHHGLAVDYFSRQPYVTPEGVTRPIAQNMVAGMIVKNNGQIFWFDYNRGALSMAAHSGMPSAGFPVMPGNILKESPISLWNTALEAHTGRIFEHLIGPFYILYVPIAGLCLITVLLSGFFLWYSGYKKKGKVTPPK